MSKPALSGVAAKPPAVAESRCQTCKPTASRKYDVYGAIRSGDSGTSAHKFVGSLGHPSEDNTGLIYMQARYMDPVTGRFVSEDPARSGVNWLVYCAGDPVNRCDPNGKFPLAGWLSFLSWFTFLCFSAAAGVWDPKDESDLRAYIAVGKGITGVVGTITTLYAILSGLRQIGTATFEKMRDRIQQQIDDDKVSTGPGATERILSAAWTEQILYVLNTDTE